MYIKTQLCTVKAVNDLRTCYTWNPVTHHRPFVCIGQFSTQSSSTHQTSFLVARHVQITFLYSYLLHTKHHFWWQDMSRSFFYIATYYTPNTIFGVKTCLGNFSTQLPTTHQTPFLVLRQSFIIPLLYAKHHFWGQVIFIYFSFYCESKEDSGI